MKVPNAYQMACGHIIRLDLGSYKVELYKEHGMYHIRTFNNNTRVDWTCKETHKDAKQYFKEVVKNIQVYTL